jgi:glyoxylase-like metal-dependent hydrolase (beta-lactamase superfamily II)
MRKDVLKWLPLFTVLVSLLLPGARAATQASAGAERGFRQPDPRQHPDVFVWTDTCNVWVLRDGEAALLIDLGDGSVLDHLAEIGVKRVEWVLFTHHHREQCQGAPRLAGRGVKVGVPAAERALFERPADFRKMQVRLGDAFTVHGASYVRPPVQPIPVDRAFARMDTFTWRGRDFWCVDTRGNSPGAMSYLLRDGGRWLAFTGDLMLDGAKLHTWFDSEWDYGFGAGVWALANSAAQVAGYDPAWLLPSHGPAIPNPSSQLAAFQDKLFKFERLLVRGYPVNSFAGAVQDPLSRPTAVPHVWRVSPHLYKFRGPDFFPNFYLLVADSGRALAIDCGLLDTNKLDAALAGMKQHLGLKQIDAVIPTHMHGDHFLQAPHLRAKHGAQIWALDRMADVCAHPERFDYAAPIQAYGSGVDGVAFDRLFRDGEKLDWEGFDLTVDWMPGQTEFALAVRGVIDGRNVVFTGDNIFGNPADPEQTGHEAVVARNSAILEEGYIYGAEYLSRHQPDLLLGGHSYVMPDPAQFIELLPPLGLRHARRLPGTAFRGRLPLRVRSLLGARRDLPRVPVRGRLRGSRGACPQLPEIPAAPRNRRSSAAGTAGRTRRPHRRTRGRNPPVVPRPADRGARRGAWRPHRCVGRDPRRPPPGGVVRLHCRGRTGARFHQSLRLMKKISLLLIPTL